jgi:hypothetical protein
MMGREVPARCTARAVLQEQLSRSLIHEAEAFCALLAAFAGGSTRDIVRRLLRRLTALQHATVDAFTRARLPTIVGIHDPCDRPFCPAQGVEEEGRAIGRAVEATLGDDDAYWFAWSPAEAPESPDEARTFRVSVDLTDLYIDLRSVLAARGLCQEYDTIWTATELLRGYRYHWHRHLVDALSVMVRIDVWTRR